MRDPAVSIVIGAYNMARELPRTIRSLSPTMQRDVDATDYEVIVVDNGSTVAVDVDACRRWGADVRVLRIPPQDASHSPVQALNAGIEMARGELIGVMIDGARLASPGLLASALLADRVAARPVILTLGFHLGPRVQMESVRQGYDQGVEDRLLENAEWTEDGYRLFDVAVFAGSSANGWFRPINESNALFLRREAWDALQGFDQRFVAPGGGYANLDLLERAVHLPGATVVTVLGEGTFHQVHGGVATNATEDMTVVFNAEYRSIRGRDFQTVAYQSVYVGWVADNALQSIAASCETAVRASRSAPAAAV